jgi:acetolactate synthase-1/3 small subunit
MCATFHETRDERSLQGQFIMLELIVKNHPGVMSHVCGLLARRGWDIEGIFSCPGQRKTQRSIWLLVNGEQPLDQIIKQAAKLQDVLQVRHRGDDADVFGQVEHLMSSCSSDQRKVCVT